MNNYDVIYKKLLQEIKLEVNKNLFEKNEIPEEIYKKAKEKIINCGG